IFKGWTDEALWAYVEYALKESDGGVELKCRPSREAEIFSSFPRRLWPSLDKITTPTRVLYGDRTYPFVAKSVARWCSLNPQVSAHAVVGGHCFMQEDPADAAERVRDFLLPNP
ncbi:TPA: alpha/beta hydrolase, partial [Pseudomonas aeruginosa]|nr:alpha/beta hydrolase [Pseudomonas aeruginosa]